MNWTVKKEDLFFNKFNNSCFSKLANYKTNNFERCTMNIIQSKTTNSSPNKPFYIFLMETVLRNKKMTSKWSFAIK